MLASSTGKVAYVELTIHDKQTYCLAAGSQARPPWCKPARWIVTLGAGPYARVESAVRFQKAKHIVYTGTTSTTTTSSGGDLNLNPKNATKSLNPTCQ